MNPTFIWLSISLFCSKTNWNKLLGDGIGPFVISDKKIKDFTIEFNYLSGENIRLSLLVKEDDAPAVAKYAGNYLKRYFSVAKFPVKEVKLPVDGVFMPFPMNTIQYGLYKIPDMSTEMESVSIILSKIIITALKDDRIDDETILTFAFYLQVGLIKALHNKSVNVADLLSIIDQFISVNKAEENVVTNHDLMYEITLDVMQTEQFESELTWINDWIKLSETAQQKLNGDDQNNTNRKELYSIRVNAIYKCLGLNDNSLRLLSKLVKKSIERYILLKTKHELADN